MKNKKKNKSIIDKQFKGNDKEINKIIKISIGVLLSFAIIYLLSGILMGEIKFKKESEKPISIQYEEILAEQTFKQKNKDYFVIYYDFDGENATMIDSTVSILKQTLTVYKVDLGNKFNSNYVETDITKIKANPSEITELKVKEPTLIRINNKKVIKFVIGKNKIINYSNNLN